MLSSALIGCFTVRLISVAHRKETQGKYIFQYFLSLLYRWEPLLICGALKLLSNAQTLFILWRAVLTKHFTRSDARQWCSGSVNHSPSSSVISPYSVYVVSEI